MPDQPWPAPERRELRSPITMEMLKPSHTGRGVVQFKSMLSDEDFSRLGDWLRRYPQMMLRVYGSYDGSIRDLEFLRFMPCLRRFDVDAVYDSLESLDGLRHLGEDVEELVIGRTRRTLDLSVVGRFGNLKTLYVEGQTKNIGVVSGLASLEDLTLRSITLPDLSLLVPLRRLLSLDIKLGGIKDLRLLPRVGDLRYLEIWRVLGLSDVSAVGRLPQLRSVFLQALKRVDQIPDLTGASRLRRVDLETMKSVRDLRPLATAPALEEVVLIDMPQLNVEDLRPLAALPHLKAVTCGLGSRRKNEAAQAMLGLPEVRGRLDWRSA